MTNTQLNQVYSNGKITNDTKELRSAIELGYRLIDTAIYYRNEAVIGKAVKESNIDRSEFFITSKIPQSKEFIETAIKVTGFFLLDIYKMLSENELIKTLLT
jgi:diketogulonate reductase-like aldo/keto reductase